MINLLILTFRLPLALRQFRSFSIIIRSCIEMLSRVMTIIGKTVPKVLTFTTIFTSRVTILTLAARSGVLRLGENS